MNKELIHTAIVFILAVITPMIVNHYVSLQTKIANLEKKLQRESDSHYATKKMFIDTNKALDESIVLINKQNIELSDYANLVRLKKDLAQHWEEK